MKSNIMKINQTLAAGSSLRSSMVSSLANPLYAEMKEGIDFDKDAVGVSVFLSGIDKWGDPKKKVGR